MCGKTAARPARASPLGPGAWQSDLAFQNQAARVKILAERKLGDLLKEMKDNGERKGTGQPEKNSNTLLPFSLEDIGLTKMQSSPKY